MLRSVNYLRRFSPFRALRDLRLFLSHRQPYELWFLLLSIVITTTLMLVFMKDSKFDRPIKREITYFDSWALSRTDEEIIAQQQIDKVIRDKQRADYQARVAKRQAEFKKVDDAMERWGL